MWKMPFYVRRYDIPATLAMLAVMVALFIVNFFGNGLLSVYLGWQPSIEWLKTGPYYQPFTFPFVHYNVIGMLFDGILLYWLGASLERAWGTAKYLFFFFTSGSGVVRASSSIKSECWIREIQTFCPLTT